MSKSARFAAMAIRHYITVLEVGRNHVTDEEAHFFDNDTTMLRGLLPTLEAGTWPENWREMDDAPKDRLIRLGGNGWSCEGRWSEANYVGVGEPKWITLDGHGLPGEPLMWAMIVPPSGSVMKGLAG